MDRLTISENLSSWIRAVSGAVGILLLSVFVLWNNVDKKGSTFTQETQTKEIQKIENSSPDEAESIEKLEAKIQDIEYQQ